MVALFDQWASGFDGAFHDAAHGDSFSSKLKTARGDAGDFQ